MEIEPLYLLIIQQHSLNFVFVHFVLRQLTNNKNWKQTIVAVYHLSQSQIVKRICGLCDYIHGHCIYILALKTQELKTTTLNYNDTQITRLSDWIAIKNNRIDNEHWLEHTIWLR